MRPHPFRRHPSAGRHVARGLGLAAAVLVASTFVAVTGAEALPDQRIGYGFEAGSGSTVADSSANNSPATATAPTWTTSGRYGNGIVFNGSASRVRSNADVTLGGAFTLEAWVLNPTAEAYETVLTVGSTRDVYLAGGILNVWTGNQNLTFGPALTANTWQHVAVVSDGATVRAYVDGAPRGSTQNLALGGVTAPLQVGAWVEENGNNADFFSGTLDEVRLYNRALSAAEVGTDRNTAVSADTGGGGPDTTPPALSGGQPTGTLAAGTTSSTLQVATNEAATCRWSTTPGTAFASMTGVFGTTGGTAHSAALNGLTNGSAYNYAVRCRDAAGNASTTDFTVTFTVATASSTQLGPWSTGTALPSGRSGNGAVAANGFMYLVGGLDSNGSVVSTVNVAPIGGSGLGAWTTTTPLPQPIRSVRPVVSNGYLYVVGGSDGNENSSAVFYAPLNANGTIGAWATTTPFPQSQLSHAVVASGGFLYVIGGNTGTTCITTVRYAPVNANGTLGGWQTTSALPLQRCGIVEAAAVSGGRVYVAGGFDNGNVTGQVFYASINPAGGLGAWTTSPSTLTNPREYTAVEAAGGILYVIGGQAALQGNVTTSVEQATINANGSLGAFSAGPSLPGPRSYLASEAAAGRIYIIGGGTDISGGTPQPTVYQASAAGAGSGGGGGLPADGTPPDRTAAAPAGTLAAGTTQASLQLTTNEAATCRYGPTAGTAYAALPTAFATTGGTAHSSPVTGLAAGSYTYQVRCRDTAGNANTTDYPITFTVAAGGGGGGGGADTTAPTVSVTAPAGGATVSGSVAVNATAADAVGVTGVQFLLDGAPLGAEDTASPYTVNWTSTTASNGAHSLTARARDAAGNQTTSAAVAVTVSNGGGGGGGGGTAPRAAYAFSASAGTAITDSSGNSTAATATNPTWSGAGRYGNAITYDGSSTRVRTNADLALGGSFTVQGWVFNPSAQAYETVFGHGVTRDLYLNYGTLNLWTGSQNLTFGPALATNTWQHVALVSDGSTVRVYVDGVQRGSTQNVALGATTAPLQVGAWNEGASNSDYFSGTIDEVRVHNRALTAAEIVTDRDTPIS